MQGDDFGTGTMEEDLQLGYKYSYCWDSEMSYFIHLSLHYSLHFIAQLNLRHIIFINTFGFHIFIFHFIHFSIKSEFVIKY